GVVALAALGCAGAAPEPPAASPRSPGRAARGPVAVEPRPTGATRSADPWPTPIACEPLAVPPLDAGKDPVGVPLPPIVDATGLVMGPFYERLARLARGRADDHVRIAVYGDSNLTMDWITGRMRRQLQARYGDAGHGFIALGRPWSHYKHMDVD